MSSVLNEWINISKDLEFYERTNTYSCWTLKEISWARQILTWTNIELGRMESLSIHEWRYFTENTLILSNYKPIWNVYKTKNTACKMNIFTLLLSWLGITLIWTVGRGFLIKLIMVSLNQGVSKFEIIRSFIESRSSWIKANRVNSFKVSLEQGLYSFKR